MQSDEIRSIRLLGGMSGADFSEDEGCFYGDQLLARRAEISALLAAHARAGADAIYAPTGCANRARLAPFGAQDQVAHYNRELAALAREAADDAALVGGCLAPTGLQLAPEGESRMEQLIELYREQAEALAGAGVDFLAVEGMRHLGEARAALLACKSCCELPVFVTVAVDEEGYTPSGSSALCCLAVLQSMGADVFGLTGPAEELPELLTDLYRYAKIPLLGRPLTLPPEQLAAYAHPLLDAGAELLAGGDTPQHTAALRRAMSAARLTGITRGEKDDEAILAATESEALLISPTIDIPDAIPITADLAEDILREEEARSGALKLRLEDAEDIEIFIENAYMLEDPLCIDATNPGLFDRFALEYHGRALFDHVGELDIDEISGIIDQYGIIVL